MRGATPRRRSAGFVLLYSLWILAAIALTLGAFSLRGRGGAAVTEQELSQALETRQMVTVLDYVLRHAAEFDVQLDARLVAYEKVMAQRAAQAAAVDDRLAVLREILQAMNFHLEAVDPRLLEQKPEAKDAKKPEPGAKAGGAARQDRTGRERRTSAVKYRPSRAPYALRVGDAEFSIVVEPGNARPNLNLLEAEPLERYLVHLGVAKERARELAAVIRDWTDSDDFTRDGGAESTYYRSLPVSYLPHNDRIQLTSELGYLKGMTPAVLRLLRENFSLPGNDPGVKPGTLDAAAFGALADLAPERAKLGLQLIDSPGEIKPGTPLLEQAEEEKLFRFVSLREETRFVRVRIQGKHSRVTAWYDTQARRMLDWWFD